MTENAPTPRPNNKSNVKRNVFIFVAVAGFWASGFFAAIALGVHSPHNPVTAPSLSATQTQEASENVDLYPEYLANSIAKLSAEGGLFMSSEMGDSVEPLPTSFYRIYNPEAVAGNLSSTLQTSYSSGDILNSSRLTNATPGQLFTQGALTNGSLVNLTPSVSEIKQTSTTTFASTTGAREVYEIANGLIVGISSTSPEGDLNVQISYGLDQNLRDVFATETQGETVQ